MSDVKTEKQSDWSCAIKNSIENDPMLEQMIHHKSIRAYTDEPVDEADLRVIIEAVQHGPNWCNFQHVSIVSVDDPIKRQKAYELCGFQEHVREAPIFWMFCADFYRTWIACDCSEEEFDRVTRVTDNIIVGTTEVGIALGSATIAAESLGLGTCCIGSAREQGLEMVELLGLPRYVFPVCGFCIGHPAADPDMKPRLPQEAVFFENSYDADLRALIHEYDVDYHTYLATRSSNCKDGSWTQEVADYYTIPYLRYGKIPKMLYDQGFAEIE